MQGEESILLDGYCAGEELGLRVQGFVGIDGVSKYREVNSGFGGLG